MKHTKYHIVVFLIVVLSLISIRNFGQGYKIKTKIEGLSSGELQLAFYFEDKQYIKQTATLNENGKAVFEGEKSLPGGLYLIIFPEGKAHFDIIISDDQHFSIRTDTVNPVKNMKIKGSRENELFYTYQKYIYNQNIAIEQWRDSLKHVDKESDIAKIIQNKTDSISRQASSYWKKLAADNSDTFLATLLEATNGADGLSYRDDYFFEHIDFSEPRLLRSPIIYKAVRIFLATNLNQHKSPQHIKNEIDRFAERVKANEDVYQYVMGYLLRFFLTFERIGMNEVFVHIAETYFLPGKAHWLDAQSLEEISGHRDRMKASFVGQIAPDIEMQTLERDYISLHQVHADYTMLFFWKAGCGHCESAAKRLKKFQNQAKSDVEVFSVFTGSNRDNWKKFVDENQLNSFINVYDPENKTKFGSYYYVVSTPILLVLDPEKRIVAKFYGDAQISSFLEKIIEEEQLLEQRN